jgi:diguanylate cyclase (GGDEF)-like protein/PAS domain S-box-containing protein
MQKQNRNEFSAQEALERIEIIFNANPNAVLISRMADGHITDINSAFTRISGYSKEESIGNTTLGLDIWVDPDDRLRFIGELQARGSCENFEAQFRRKDGSQFAGSLTAGTITILGIPHIISTTRDISESKQVELRNEVLMLWLQALMASALEGIHIMDMHGNIVEANDTFSSMLGYTREEITRLNVADWDAQWSREELMERFKVLIRLNSALFETRHRRKDGTVLDVEVSTTGAEIDGQYYLFASSRDITERKRAEEAMRIAAVTFETQEAILITDAGANILRVNHAFQDISGYSAEEVIGKNPSMLQSGRHDAAFYQAMWSELLGTGKWAGEIWDRRKSGEIYPKSMTITAVYDDRQRVTHFVAVFRDISSRKKTEQEIHQLAFYDPLTGLPNRRLLLDRLHQALAASARNSRHGALLFLDLDNFKVVNDTQGHVMGDKLLIEVASRLQTCVREGDSVARLGGDEFVVVLEDLSSEADEAAAQSELVAEKIQSELKRPYLFENYKCLSTVSIGISLFFEHRESTEDLLQHADVAMYQAKVSGRNAIRFFDPHMQMALEARAEMENDLRHALERQQFQLYYQVQVDNRGRALGAEVLLRWDRPDYIQLSPMEFIPLAEESELIVPIGLWVLQTACAQLRAWQDDPLTRGLTLAVNVSAKQFRQPDFVAQVQRVLLESGAQPSRLKLELTESTVLENVEDTIRKLLEIKALGVSFSMDDFGTGYSSLQYLKRLPLNQIKIDQSFVLDIVTDANDAAIVQTIIAMSEALGLDVIAEGVETEAQREFLSLRGCQAYQGYLFGRPVPLAEFELLLRSC